MFFPLAFALEKLVYEAGGVFAALGFSCGEFRCFGGDERRFTAVDLFRFEDYLLC